MKTILLAVGSSLANKIVSRRAFWFLWLFALGFVGSFVGVGVVLAVTATPPPTSTFIPPSPSPTPLNFSCPVGTPAGWGTYTPSGLWSATCSDCASISTPTSPPIVATWSGTGTPWTLTPAPTVTIAPTVTSAPSVTLGCLDNYCTVINSQTISYTFNAGPSGSYARAHVYGLTGPSTVSAYFYVNMYLNTGATTGHAYQHWTRMYGTGSMVGATFLDAGNINGAYSDAAESRHVVVDGLTADINDWSTFGSGLRFSINSQWSSVTSITGTVIISLVPYGATPTPTVTATSYMDSGYCSSVAPSSDDFGFDLFVDDGTANCTIGWEEFTVSDVTVPAVTICLQPVIVGYIRLFGTDYSMDVILIVACAAFVWRLMRTL